MIRVSSPHELEIYDEAAEMFRRIEVPGHVLSFDLRAMRVFEGYTSKGFLDALGDPSLFAVVVGALDVSNRSTVDLGDWLGDVSNLEWLEAEGLKLVDIVQKEISSTQSAGGTPPIYEAASERHQKAPTFTDYVVTLSSIGIDWRTVEDWHLSLVSSLFASSIAASKRKPSATKPTAARIAEISAENRRKLKEARNATN